MYFLLLYQYTSHWLHYDAAFLYNCWFLFIIIMELRCKYAPFWQEFSVKSLILRWPLRPVGLLLLMLSFFCTHLNGCIIIHIDFISACTDLWKPGSNSYTYKYVSLVINMRHCKVPYQFKRCLLVTMPQHKEDGWLWRTKCPFNTEYRLWVRSLKSALKLPVITIECCLYM